jgi:hypothetical protein
MMSPNFFVFEYPSNFSGVLHNFSPCEKILSLTIVDLKRDSAIDASIMSLTALSVRKNKKNTYFFGSLLAYSYLCNPKLH